MKPLGRANLERVAYRQPLARILPVRPRNALLSLTSDLALTQRSKPVLPMIYLKEKWRPSGSLGPLVLRSLFFLYILERAILKSYKKLPTSHCG